MKRHFFHEKRHFFQEFGKIDPIFDLKIVYNYTIFLANATKKVSGKK